MAKKITVAPEEAKTEEVQVQVAEEQMNEPAPAAESPEEVVNEKENQHLPDYADKACRIFTSLDELYVNTKGGVFTKDTKPALRGSAILFKNPYYKL